MAQAHFLLYRKSLGRYAKKTIELIGWEPACHYIFVHIQRKTAEKCFILEIMFNVEDHIKVMDYVDFLEASLYNNYVRFNREDAQRIEVKCTSHYLFRHSVNNDVCKYKLVRRNEII